ncbi:hypothetical protein AB9K41_07775 [Cribrihabitans sp. XS_ASV171]
MSGWVEILPGWDAENRFVVMDWSESRDSGWMVGGYSCRSVAEVEAEAFAAKHKRKMVTAEIIPFPAGRAMQ